MKATTATKKKWFVEIVEFDGMRVFSRMECYSLRDAHVVDSGANRNLNHERFYTRIVEGADISTGGDVQGAGSS